MKTKVICIDLDETLIFSVSSPTNFKRKIKLDCGNYGTYVKEGSREFLDALRLKYGHENVWMLTAATSEYAAEINIKANLGFRPDMLLSREHHFNYYPIELKHTNIILFDNLDHYEFNTKVKLDYLSNLGLAKVLLAPQYTGSKNSVFSSEKIEKIIQQLEEKFNEF